MKIFYVFVQKINIGKVGGKDCRQTCATLYSKPPQKIANSTLKSAVRKKGENTNTRFENTRGRW